MAATDPARAGSRRHRVTAYVVLVALAVFFLFPVVFMVAGAFKPDDQVLTDADSLSAFVPTELTTENFEDAFDRASFGRLFVNSTIIAVFVVGLGMIVNSLAGYALARLPFPGARLLVLAVVALTIIPLEAVAIPLLFMVSELGWRDTYHVQILPFVANPLFIYLFYTFFLGVPKELEEAARIDGAGPWTTFIRVVVPQARPAYATVGVLSFLFVWGQLLWPVLVTSSTDVRPLPLGLSILIAQPPISWGDIMAFALMMTAPLLVVFVLFQRWFVRSVARSGLKG
jgi:multiple sugar transport system permease protein